MSIQFNVPDMSCGHCVGAITKAVQQVAPGASVDIDLASHRVTVTGTTDIEPLRQAMADVGYEATVV